MKTSILNVNANSGLKATIAVSINKIGSLSADFINTPREEADRLPVLVAAENFIFGFKDPSSGLFVSEK